MADRTVGQVVLAVQEGGPATDQELRLALLCLYYNGQMAVDIDAEESSLLKLRMLAKEINRRWFEVNKQAPAKYLGPRWTPGTQENDEGRAVSLKVLAAVERKLAGRREGR